MTRMSLGEAFIFNPKVAISRGSIVPFVTMQMLQAYRRDVTTQEVRNYTSGSKFCDGDVLMARITPSLENGKTSIYRAPIDIPIREGYGSTEFIVVRGRPGVSDSTFIYYVLTSEEVRNIAIKSMTGSSGRQRVQQEVLESISIDLPSIERQKEITNILALLDDKIELNLKTVLLIQNLSRSIFASWKNGVEIKTTVSFGEYADIYGGSTPRTSTSEYWGGEYAWATPSDVTGLSAPYLFDTSRTITKLGLANCASILHDVGTILMTSRATIGSFALNQVPMATNQGFIAVRPKIESETYFLFEEMRSRVNEFIDNSNGSTFAELSRSRFKELPLELPSHNSINLISGRLKTIHAKGSQVMKEVNHLSSLRELFKKKFISNDLFQK